MTEEEKQEWLNLPIHTVMVRAEALTKQIDTLESELVIAEQSARFTGHQESRQALVNSLQSQISDNELSVDVAKDIYEDFANWLNKTTTGVWVNPFQTKWTVTVKYGELILKEIKNVEAETEEEAIDSVTDDLEVRNVVISCDLRYIGSYDEDTDYSDQVDHDEPEWDLLDELDITAERAEA
jgi:hypothetical protein